MLFIPFAAFVSAAVAGPEVGPDSIRFELTVGGDATSGFQIDSTEQVAIFNKDSRHPEPVHEERQGEPGSFARTKTQLALYRSLADEGCTPGPSDILQYRLIWRESGVDHTAVFADSCKGFPVGLTDRMRALADIFDDPDPAPEAAQTGQPSRP